MNVPVTFNNGDVFSARALANGTVEIYRNGNFAASRPVTFARAPQSAYAFQPVSFKLPSFHLVPLQQSSPFTLSYVYDPLNRLNEANYSNGDYYHYTYDAVGNRLTQETSVGGLVTT